MLLLVVLIVLNLVYTGRVIERMVEPTSRNFSEWIGVIFHFSMGIFFILALIGRTLTY